MTAATSSRSELDAGFRQYLNKVHRIPLLQPAEEAYLAKQAREHGDREAAHRIISSHLRLVISIASKYRGYGFSLGELVAEGNIGLMQAVQRFEPERGFRFATYAVCWIRAAIQSYILRSKSMVKIGTTANQRKLFFNLRKTLSSMSVLNDRGMSAAQVDLVATRIGVTKEEVIEMIGRLSGDVSLNVPLPEASSETWTDRLADGAPNQEEILADREHFARCRAVLAEALTQLNDRERSIIASRHLSEKPKKLREIANEFGVSRERVRQIELAAFAKLQKIVRARTRPPRQILTAA
jgi:RNA polymerase sigma-32 factor